MSTSIILTSIRIFEVGSKIVPWATLLVRGVRLDFKNQQNALFGTFSQCPSFTFD